MMFNEATIHAMRYLNRDNKRTAAMALAAIHLGLDALADELDNIEAQHEAIGYLSADNRARRDRAVEQIKGHARATLDATLYRKLAQQL